MPGDGSLEDVRMRWAAAVLTATMFGLSGCGLLGLGDDPPDEAGLGDGGEEARPDSTVPPEPVTRPVGKSGWWGGFRITAEEVTAEATLFGADVSVTVQATFENLGDESADPPGKVCFDAGGANFFADVDSPAIGGGGMSPATIAGTVDARPLTTGDAPPDLGAVLDTLVLVYGEAGDNQTKIPLGDGPVETFEPRQLDVAGEATQGDMVIAVTGGSMRPSYKRGENGMYELALDFEIGCGDSCGRITGVNIDRGSFVLTSPAGASVAPDSRSPWCCAALDDDPGRIVKADQTVVFLVTEPLTGTFELEVTGDRNDDTPEPFRFDLS